jgi:hypothetical protein
MDLSKLRNHVHSYHSDIFLPFKQSVYNLLKARILDQTSFISFWKIETKIFEDLINIYFNTCTCFKDVKKN